MGGSIGRAQEGCCGTRHTGRPADAARTTTGTGTGTAGSALVVGTAVGAGLYVTYNATYIVLSQWIDCRERKSLQNSAQVICCTCGREQRADGRTDQGDLLRED